MAVYQNPEETARKVLSMLRKYNVMYPEQLVAFFYGEETSVLRAIRRLEKKRQLYLNPYTGLLASSENAYSLKDDGTILSLWVLADLCRRRPVEYHFLAEHEDFPVRLLFISSQELYDIVYVDVGSLKLVNGLYREGRRPAESHIVVLEDGNLIGQVQIPGAIGYCVVKEGGVVEYYRKKQGGRTGGEAVENPGRNPADCL